MHVGLSIEIEAVYKTSQRLDNPHIKVKLMLLRGMSFIGTGKSYVPVCCYVYLTGIAQLLLGASNDAPYG